MRIESAFVCLGLLFAGFSPMLWAQSGIGSGSSTPSVEDEFQESNDIYQSVPIPDGSNLESSSAETNTSGNDSLGSSVSVTREKYQRPQGPKAGGKFKIPHPNSSKGLQSIDKKGVYQYRVPLRDKSQAASVRFGSTSTPKFSGSNGVTFGDVYGTEGMTGILGEYEWQPFRGFGALGFQLGGGLIVARGNGRFADRSLANETYSLYVVPVSGFIVYRFEYARRQWIVPYINGGFTYFGLMEQRDDGKRPNFAGSPAMGGGGGVHITISRLDDRSAFLLGKQYGVADVWLTIEARVTVGLKKDLDFSSQTLSAGFTVDY